MPKRDINGRFIKEEEEFKIIFTLPSLSKLILWVLLLFLLSPWIMAIIRLPIWKDILSKFEMLFLIKGEEAEQTKKNGIFY